MSFDPSQLKGPVGAQRKIRVPIDLVQQMVAGTLSTVEVHGKIFEALSEILGPDKAKIAFPEVMNAVLGEVRAFEAFERRVVGERSRMVSEILNS